MLIELYGNAGMQLLGSITHHQSWQCSAQPSFAGCPGTFPYSSSLCNPVTQSLLAQPEMPPREVIPIGFSIPPLGGRVSSVFWQGATCKHRIFWLQKIKQQFIIIVRGLSCFNSHSHFCWYKCVHNMSLCKNSKLFLSRGHKSIQRWRAKTSCRYPPFGNSLFTPLTEEARRSTHA